MNDLNDNYNVNKSGLDELIHANLENDRSGSVCSN